jgi:LysM repeat protein
MRAPATAAGPGLPARAQPSEDGTSARPESSLTEYQVRRGDTLYGIVRRYGVTADAIRRANEFEGEAIRAGMILTIPPASTTPEARSHTVRPGDTLYSLARAHGTTVVAIQRANGLASTGIRIGTVLIIPAEASAVTHTVRRGDTLYSIAGHYGTTVGALEDSNRLAGSVIVPGMVLVMP